MSYQDHHQAWLEAVQQVATVKEELFDAAGVCYLVMKIGTDQAAVGIPAPGDPEGHQAAFRDFEQRYGIDAKYGLFLGVAIRQPVLN
jgi:hypothetical protein